MCSVFLRYKFANDKLMLPTSDSSCEKSPLRKNFIYMWIGI